MTGRITSERWPDEPEYALSLHLHISLKQRTTLPFEVLNLRQEIFDRYVKVN